MIIFGALLVIGGLFLNAKTITLMTVLIGLGLLAGGIIGLCKKPKYNNNYALYIAIYTKGEEHISMKDYVYSNVGDTNDTKNLEAENITEIIMCNPESAKKLANELSDAILEAQESR